MSLGKKKYSRLVASIILVPLFGFHFASAGSPESVLHPSIIDEKSLQVSNYPAEGVVLGRIDGCDRSSDSLTPNTCPVVVAVATFVGTFVATKVADYAWDKAETNKQLDKAIQAAENALDGGPQNLAESGYSAGNIAKTIEEGAVSEDQFDNY